MIRYDAEGHVHRSYWPHLAILALFLAGFVWDRLGPRMWSYLVLGEVLEPVTLLLAGIAGWWILKHRYLLPILLVFGVIVGFGVTAVDFEHPGRAAHLSLVMARVIAIVGAGYLVNALRILVSPPPPRY